jgi:hypothetical protein
MFLRIVSVMAVPLAQQVRDLRKEFDSIKAEALRLQEELKKAKPTAKPAPTTSAPKPTPAPTSTPAAKPAPTSAPTTKPAPTTSAPKPTPTPTSTPAAKPAPTPASKPSPVKPAASAPKPSPSAGGEKPSVIQVSNPDGVHSLVEQVKKGVIDWLVIGYEDNNNRVGVKISGSGGINELKKNLPADQPVYALLRVAAPGTTSVKFVFITWIGPKVGALKKARVSTHSVAVGDLFGAIHVRMMTDSQDELNSQSIDAKIRHAAGTDYDRGY